MNKQREVIYEQRQMVLAGEDLKEHVLGMVNEVVEEKVGMYCPEGVYPEKWEIAAFLPGSSKAMVGIQLSQEELLRLNHLLSRIWRWKK